MKKTLLIAILFAIHLNQLAAQDIIYKEDGTEMKTRVMEVGKRSITYKDFNDPDFTTLLIPVSEVTKIRFEDGREQVFNNNLLKHFVGITLEGSSPFGHYANNTNNPKDGYAKRGGGWQIDGGIYLKKNFGLNVNFGGATHSLDTERLVDPFRGSPNFNFHNNGNTGVEYRSVYFFAGPMYSLRLSKKFSWDFKLLTGALGLHRTSFTIQGGNPPNNFTNSYEPMRGTGLGFKFGTDIRFAIFKWMGVRLSIEIIRANPKLTGKVNVSTNNSSTVSERNVFYQRYAALNTGLGLVFMFNR